MSEPTKTVVITGTSSGFGEGAVRDFADRGYRVWGTMRDVNGRNATQKAALEAHSTNISIIDMDMNSDDAVTSGFADIIAADPIDILINNAGIMDIGLTEAFSLQQSRDLMETNYFGAIRATQAVLPGMRAAGSGLIINCSSSLGRMTGPFFGTYAATKHALEAYMQALRYEVSGFGVDITLVEPGPFGTNLINIGRPAARKKIIAEYGELANVPDAMLSSFSKMLNGPESPDPQLVVDLYCSLADMPAGQRPTRSVVGMTWGVSEINHKTQPIQDAILKDLQLDTVLGGSDA
jgi:short-subunit dehydrogenase